MSSLSPEKTPESSHFSQLENFYNALFVGSPTSDSASNTQAISDFRPALNEYWTVRFEAAGNNNEGFFKALAQETLNELNIIELRSSTLGERISRTINSRAMGTDRADSITSACLYAQAITIPGDKVATAAVQPLPGSGAIMFPPVLGNREASNVLAITFMESNMSFTDLVVRPWINICAKKGLVALRANPQFKINIVADFIKMGSAVASTLPGPNRNGDIGISETRIKELPSIRKTFTFYDCVPVSVASQSHSYKSGTVDLRQVDFMYSKHTIG